MWNSSPPINVICTNRLGIRAYDRVGYFDYISTTAWEECVYSLCAPTSVGWFYLTSQWGSNKKVGPKPDPRRARTSCQIVGYHWKGRRQWQDSGLGFQWWRQFPLQISRLSFFLICLSTHLGRAWWKTRCGGGNLYERRGRKSMWRRIFEITSCRAWTSSGTISMLLAGLGAFSFKGVGTVQYLEVQDT